MFEDRLAEDPCIKSISLDLRQVVFAEVQFGPARSRHLLDRPVIARSEP